MEQNKMEENKNINSLKKPSKKLITRLAAGAIALVLFAGVGVFAAEKMEDSKEQKAAQEKQEIALNQAKEKGLTVMTEEEAKQLALQTAGVEESQTKHLRVTIEDDEDLQADFVYEVEFTANGLEYEILIDGVQQTVLHSEVE